jgi:hypothetical protein
LQEKYQVAKIMEKAEKSDKNKVLILEQMPTSLGDEPLTSPSTYRSFAFIMPCNQEHNK